MFNYAFRNWELCSWCTPLPSLFIFLCCSISLISSTIEGCIIISKYAYCRTSRLPADVTLPFPCRGGFDSCACLLSRQENHRAEVKKHVLSNVSPFVTACPESRLKQLSWRGSPTGRNLKNASKPSSRGESAGKEVMEQRARGHEKDKGELSIWTIRHLGDINEKSDHLKRGISNSPYVITLENYRSISASWISNVRTSNLAEINLCAE